MTITIPRPAILAVALILFALSSASGLSIREWCKRSRDQQSVYVGAAVSMAANMYSPQGNTTKAMCIMDFFFRGKDGHEPTGPHDLAIEIGMAERSDPDKYQIEWVVLGVTSAGAGHRSNIDRARPRSLRSHVFVRVKRLRG